ncbi:hypothetical protein C0995_013236, partial [Termitomyces sp. Mi166
MVRLRKNVKQVLVHTSAPVSAPPRVPLSSLGHSLVTNLPENLGHPSPSVFTPHSVLPQQFAPILPPLEPSQQNPSSGPPPAIPYPAYLQSFANSQSLPVLSGGGLDLISSAYSSQQPSQNLSFAPPQVFIPHFAHPQSPNASHPPAVFSSGNIGFQSLVLEDDDSMDIEREEIPLGEPMLIDSVEIVMQDINDHPTHAVEPTMQRNHFGVCTTLPFPLVTQQNATVPEFDPEPVLYPESCHPLPWLPTIYDDLDTPNPSSAWSTIDTAHPNSSYPSTPSYPSLREAQAPFGWSANDTTLVHPIDQAALRWSANDTARVRSTDSYT